MIELRTEAPPCRICGQQMARRIRGEAQAALEPEFVCRNFDCLEFGIVTTRR